LTYSPLNQAPQPQFRQCFNCNFEALSVNSVCPRCRKNKFFTSDNIRIRGVVAAVMGLFIAGLIGAVAVFVGSLLLAAIEDPASSKRIAENQLTLLAIYGFFVLLIGLGLYFVAAGIWMLAFGKRNRLTVLLMWLLISIVFGAGGILSVLT